MAAIKWAGDFQAQLNTINTIAFATPEALGKIGDGIREVAKKTGISTDELTSAYYDLLSAGIKTADAQAVLNDAVTLGIGGLATTQQTVDLLTTAYNAYGLTAAGAATATDQFAQAVADGKVTAAQIAESFANVASLAKTAGVGIDQIAASYAFLTAQGVPAAEVTTEMQRAIVSLMKPLPALAEAQKKLKINFAEDVTKEGLVPALQKLRDYSDKTGVPLLDLLGRIEAVKFVLQTTGPNAAGFATELDKITHSSGMAAKQMAEREQGFNYQLDVLKANVKDAGITIGSALLPKLAELSAKASKFLQDHEGDVKAFATDLAAGFERAAHWAGTIDWTSIGDAIRGIAGFGRDLAKAFVGMPTEAKELLLGLYGLNKLSGGAVVNIGVDLFKGGSGALFQQFLGRGSPANPMFVVMEGGAGGLPVSGGKGGALGGLLGAIPLVAFTAAVGAVTFEVLDTWTRQNKINAGRNPDDPTDRPVTGDDLRNRGRYGMPLPGGAGTGGLSPDERDELHAGRTGGLSPDERQELHEQRAALDRLSGAMAKAASAPWLAKLEDSWRKAGKTMHDKIQAAIKGLTGPHAGAAALFLGANLGSHGFGAGGLTQANAVLAELKAMKQTPEVVKAIRELEAKLPRLRTDAKDLAAAEQIANSTDPKNKKLDGLNRIMADLKAHGDKTTQHKVNDLITAVKQQKTHITVNVPVAVSIADVNAKSSIRQTYRSGYNYET